MTNSELRVYIIEHLESLGYRREDIEAGQLKLPEHVGDTKAFYREIQQLANTTQVSRARSDLFWREPEILERFVDGSVVVPEKISPRLVFARTGSLELDIFNYIKLTSSVPTGTPRGAVARYVIEDSHTGGVMGAIVIGSPLRFQGARDAWVGWTPTERDARLQTIAEAWGIVSIPPYSQLLAGKLMALVAVCNEVREEFENRYERPLALVTTNSALGRSSVYNRLKYHEEKAFLSIGWTRGYGNFHLDDPVIVEAVRKVCRREFPDKNIPNKMAMFRYTLPKLGLDSELINHGLRREVFAVPMARNTIDFLHARTDTLDYFDRPFSGVVEWWRDRWMLKRASWDERYKEAKVSDLQVWGAGEDTLRGTQMQLF